MTAPTPASVERAKKIYAKWLNIEHRETFDWIAEIASALADVEREMVRDFVERVECRAEADMLAGNPIEGAHYRAMQEEARAAEERRGERER